MNENMFIENGEFIPQTAHHGNISGEVAHLRNVYLTAEKDYFTELLQNEDMLEYLRKVINCSSDYLFEEAVKEINKLENGELETEVEKQRMEKMSGKQREMYHIAALSLSEGKIALLLAAIEDKALIKMLIKKMDERRESENEDNESHGLGM